MKSLSTKLSLLLRKIVFVSTIITAGTLTFETAASETTATTTNITVNTKGSRYWSINYTPMNIAEASVTAATLRAGYRLTEKLALESRLLVGIDAGITEGATVRLDNLFAAHLRYGKELAEGLYPYAIIGLARTALSQPILTSNSTTGFDLSYGFGLDLFIHETVTINAEITSYFDNDDNNVTAFSIGITDFF